MNKVYACTDIHGNYKLWEQIKNYLDETDTLYFLGDAADRGPDGMRIILDLLKDKRVIYLLGNHEDMMIEGGSMMVEGRSYNHLWEYNGGGPTIDAFMKMSLESQEWVLRRLASLPRFAKYENKNGQKIFMCHAGTTPGCDEAYWGRRGIRDSFIWNRDHFYEEWDEWYEENYPNTYIVHGHTPVQYLLRDAFMGKEASTNYKNFTLGFENEGDEHDNLIEYRYFNGHKINLDVGTIMTNRVVLLDLDTLEAKYFDNNEEKD